jgi:hypothetical protein
MDGVILGATTHIPSRKVVDGTKDVTSSENAVAKASRRRCTSERSGCQLKGSVKVPRSDEQPQDSCVPAAPRIPHLPELGPNSTSRPVGSVVAGVWKLMHNPSHRVVGET